MTDLTKSTTDTLAKQSLASIKKPRLRTLAKSKARSIKTSGVHTFILGDVSGSMQGQKLEALKDVYASCWSQNVTGVIFGSEVYLITQSDIPRLSSSGMTHMGEALQCAWNEGAEHIILITDGDPNDIPKHKILQLAEQNSHIPIDCIGISGGPNDTAYDEQFLLELSNITKGKYNSCEEPLELTNIVKNLMLEAPKQTHSNNTIQL